MPRIRLTSSNDTGSRVADELSVSFTWEDPTVFLAPHTYSYTYKRLPEGIPIENNEDPATAQPDRQYTTTKAEK